MLKEKLYKIFRRYLITGMIVIIPLWITILLIKAVVNLVDGTLNLIPPVINPKTYIPFFGIELIIALFLIILVGVLANNYLGKKIFGLGEIIVAKIPVIKTIYQGVKYLTIGIMSDKKIFSQVVLVEFPRKGLFCIAFVTGEEKYLFSNNKDGKMLKIFIPTTPNPTSGFFFMVAENEVKYLDLSVDEAFKLIISAGYSNFKID